MCTNMRTTTGRPYRITHVSADGVGKDIFVVSCNIKIFTFALSPVSRELSQRESLMNSKPRPWGEVARGGVPRSELVSFGGSRDSVTERGEIQF